MPDIPTSTTVSPVLDLYPCLFYHSFFTMCAARTQNIQVDNVGHFCRDTQSADRLPDQGPGMIANHETHGTRAGFLCFT
ncbi:MAG TPA: hypothetical protein DCZ04_07835 [Syntrophorhabdus aromaticivorans]|nr:hypothetical protein [Syntrophorhabdus aromaticivorans]